MVPHFELSLQPNHFHFMSSVKMLPFFFFFSVETVLMAEMVASTVVQEVLGGAVSYLSGNREKVSERHNLEKLEMAHAQLEHALERSSKLPITDVSLLRQRRMFKRAYEECSEVVEKCKVRILEVAEEQGVTHSYFPKQFVQAVKAMKSYVLSFLGMNKQYLLSCSHVRRFEWFAKKAGKFARDVETGRTLWHYNFFSSLIRPLLEGKHLKYDMPLQGSKTLGITIVPVSLEGRGVEALIQLNKEDSRMPLKNFCLLLILRLSESTDIVRIIINCLQLLGPHFMRLAKDAIGQLAALQHSHPQDLEPRLALQAVDYHRSFLAFRATVARPDPFCCREKRLDPCADNTISPNLPYDIPEQVIYVRCSSYISAVEYNYLYNSSNIVRDWSILKMVINISPHFSHPEANRGSYSSRGATDKCMYASLHEMQEMAVLVPKVMDCFVCQPDLGFYSLSFHSVHGYGYLCLMKPRIRSCKTNSSCRSKARRVSKRRHN